MMFTKESLNPKKYGLTPDQSTNLDRLAEVMNKLAEAYGKPMMITSGLRSAEDQAKINPKAPKSKHLLGCAVDVFDADGKLNEWCKANEVKLTECGLWCESRQGNWQHFQCVQYGSWVSGKTRFFNP